jgi:hypothetical protein
MSQEGPFTPGPLVAFCPAYNGDDLADDDFDSPPCLSFRFSNFLFSPQDVDLLSGAHQVYETYYNGNSSMYWSLQDCAIRGGQIYAGYTLSSGYPRFSPPGSMSLINNTFDCVNIVLIPTYYADGAKINLDFSASVYNNLFRGGQFILFPNPSAFGDWVVKDNLFDGVLFLYPPSLGPLDHDFNAYWPYQYEPEPDWSTHLWVDANTPDLFAPNDKQLSAARDYQPGPFGDRYLQTSSPLYSALYGAGSRTPAEAGLSQFTMRVDQVKEGSEPAGHKVNIGPHYVAANPTTGLPYDSDSDGIPDYVADADGNGLVDSTDTPPPPTPITPVTKAHNDVFVVQQGSSDTLLDVLANDTDSQWFPLTPFFPASEASTPHGTARPSTDDPGLLYSPSGSYSGIDTFTYAIVNDFNRESSATATIFVSPAGTPLTAPDKDFAIDSGEASHDWNLVTGAGVTLAFVGTSKLGIVGIVNPSNPGTIHYQRNTSVAGADAFPYVLTDASGRAAIGTVTISRNTGSNHAPQATSYSTTGLKGQPLNLTLIASDPDSDPLTYVISQPQHGSVTGSGPEVTYTPATDFMGVDSFSFQASDGSLRSPLAVVAIKVQSANSAPVAYSAQHQVVLNTPLAITLSAYDSDGDHLTYSHDSSAPHGTLSEGGPNLTYTPNNDYEGFDSFNFTVSDGKQTAQATISLTVTRQQIITLTSPQTDYTFKGNMTYYVTSPVTLNGTTTIEGGAVVKFGWKRNENDPGSKLIFNGPVNCQTSPYRPAIFTAEDDDTVGAVLPTSWGIPYYGAYADVALEMPVTGGTDLKYVRIAYAKTAIRYPGGNTITTVVSDTARHVQILYCQEAFRIEGNDVATPPVNRQLAIRNCLVCYGRQAFTGSAWNAQAEHLTVYYFEGLTPDPNLASYTLHATNSVFAQIGALGGAAGANLDGDYNGFYVTDFQFGADPVSDTTFPFAPVPSTYPEALANVQAAAYLRDESPFIGTGTPNITPGLKADLAQATTTLPQLFTADVTSSQTLSPTVSRDTDVPSLGYHYPVIDYVLNGATVNNCTLNIDQGTILGFAYQGYEWGLRLNPGGRLNVNGVPTNRVVFARLEAVQENPLPAWQQPTGPLITFKGVILPSGTLVTPLPEARLRYADFPTLAGNAVHFGPLTANQDQTYDCVRTLKLDGCLFQGGTFSYESGGPPDRTVSLRNTIFERSFMELTSRQTNRGNNDETLTAANNLFYDCDMWLVPAITTDNGWTFIDNIFDQVKFHGNGPVGVNHHNAYVGMAGNPNNTDRLSPRDQQPDSNPILDTLAYDTGPLGRFYLPATDTSPSLRNAGSRSAALAGLYHFTSLATNVKQADSIHVNIGPSYVAMANEGRATLVNNAEVAMDFKITSTPAPTGPGNITLAAGASVTITPGAYISAWPAGGAGSPLQSEALPHGTSFTGTTTWHDNTFSILDTTLILGPADSNHDGVPDFIADHNGDGDEEADEMPWTSQNNNSLAILSPLDGSTVGGIIQLRVGLPAAAAGAQELIPLVDGRMTSSSTTVGHPAGSTASVEIDTRVLEDGSHSFALAMDDPASDPWSPTEVASEAVALIVSNSRRFPDWHNMAEEAVNVQLKLPTSATATLWFFDDSYPKSYSPLAAAHVDVSASTGVIDYAEALSTLGIADTTTEVYSLTEQNSGGQSTAAANPNTAKGVTWPGGSGKWVAAYEDDGADYAPKFDPQNPDILVKIADHYDYNAAFSWLHDHQLGSWAVCGGAETLLAAPPIRNGHTVSGGPTWVPNDKPGFAGEQTWPVRSAYKLKVEGKDAYKGDIKLLKSYLKQADARNFYGRGHGPSQREKTTMFFHWHPTEAKSGA